MMYPYPDDRVNLADTFTNLELTKGAPMNAISNSSSFSLVRHCTQGSLAKVVIPEKTASAVTNTHISKNIEVKCAIPSPSPGYWA